MNPFGRIGRAGAHRPHPGLGGRGAAESSGAEDGNNRTDENATGQVTSGGVGQSRATSGNTANDGEGNAGAQGGGVGNGELVRDPAKTIVSPDAAGQ
jgi:hypothetical protein